MMNYNEFKMELQGNLQKDYENASIKIMKMNQMNRTFEAMTIHVLNSGAYLPSIDLEYWFKKYENLGDSGIAHVYEKIRGFLSGETVRLVKTGCTDSDIGNGGLFISLVNAEMNKDMLKDVPHKAFLDLAIICRKRVEVEGKEDCIASITITNALLAHWNITEDELFEMATENTRKNYLAETFSLCNIFGVPSFNLGERDANCVYDMEVVTNKEKYEGAVNALVFHDGLKEIADKMDSNLFILPSSRHEVICVSTEMGDAKSLFEIVESINGDSTVVSQNDILSNSVYYYDREKDEISIAEC